MIEARNIIWVFGAGRSGSTWLARMLATVSGCSLWPEPQLGELFDVGRFGAGSLAGSEKASHPSFILSKEHREPLLEAARRLTLDGAAARFPQASGVVVKEPHGSAGAPVLLEAIPESRVVVNIRDPRDTVASALAALGDMWSEGWRGMYSFAEGRSEWFVEDAAREYLRHMQAALGALRAHKGPGVVVRYEDLRADAVGEMRRVCREAGIEADPLPAVRRHSWESVPAKKKGEGKFHRKAAPGSYAEDLTPEQIATVEEITAPILREFYS